MEDQEEPVTPDFDNNPPATFLSPLKSTSRVIVRSDIIHERDGKPSRFWGQPYAYPVQSSLASFEAELEVGEQWIELQLWGNGNPSLLYLKNMPTKFHVNPTPAQQAEADAKIAEVGIGDSCDDIIVRPGRDCQFEPGCDDGSKLYVRCRKGTTTLLVMAVPQ